MGPAIPPALYTLPVVQSSRFRESPITATVRPATIASIESSQPSKQPIAAVAKLEPVADHSATDRQSAPKGEQLAVLGDQHLAVAAAVERPVLVALAAADQSHVRLGQ